TIAARSQMLCVQTCSSKGGFEALQPSLQAGHAVRPVPSHYLVSREKPLPQLELVGQRRGFLRHFVQSTEDVLRSRDQRVRMHLFRFERHPAKRRLEPRRELMHRYRRWLCPTSKGDALDREG